jgi:hypothetical protein
MRIAECRICKDSGGRSELFTNVIHKREDGIMYEREKQRIKGKQEGPTVEPQREKKIEEGEEEQVG